MPDEFDDIVKALELVEPEPEEVKAVSKMSDADLVVAYNDVRRQLNKLDEMHEPKTQAGRELHSQRAAMIVYLRRRGLT